MQTETGASALNNCIIVIPALEPDGALPAYVSALLERGAAQVVAVDDGSSPACDGIFRQLEAMAGCTLLRHQRNQGKGRALKDAFHYILSQSAWTGCTAWRTCVPWPRPPWRRRTGWCWACGI